MKHPRTLLLILVTLAACWLSRPVVAAPEAEHAVDGHAAATDHGHGGLDQQAHPMDPEVINFIAALIVFGIAFGILAKLAWPKILKGLDDRDNKIREEIFAAEQARQRANEALQEYEKSLAEARAEAAAMIEQTRAEQSRLAAEYRQEAETQRTQMLDSARQSIEAAKRAALNEIYAETALLATSVASKILGREINADDQKHLVQETLTEVGNQYAGSSH